MDREKILARLESDMQSQIQKIKQSVPRYTPTYYIKMLREHGAFETARRLLSSNTNSQGFIKLLEYGQIELTLEFLVVNDHEYSQLFHEDTLKIAKMRLGVR